MLESQLSNSRKRRYPEQPTPPQNKASQHPSKKRKRTHVDEARYPPAFWGNLSKIDLTKRALDELDRRNNQTALSSHPPDLGLCRPITRAELRKDRGATYFASNFLCRCDSKALRDIRRSARHGGPDLSGLRRFPKPLDLPNETMSRAQSSSRDRTRGSMPASNSQSNSNTTTSKSTGPYNRNFQQNLIDGRVYPDGYEYPDGRVPPQPANWEGICRRLAQQRRSLSPSTFTDDDFRNFKRVDAHASKEKQVISLVIPIIEGKVSDNKCVSGGIPFTNLDHLTDGTLVPGNPDSYDGARPEQLDRRVRDELSGHIIPSTQDDLPIVPNFFLAVKGPDGSAAVAKRQASYDGALGARGMHSLQSYGQNKPIYENNAYTITSTYNDGTLKIFTSHSTQPAVPGGRPGYCTHQLRSFAMADTADTFRQGATYYRNARDWAKEQRDEAITRANERVRESPPDLTSVDPSFGETESFTSEATLETYTTVALSQESRTLRTKDSNTTTSLHEHETSSDELSSDHRRRVKRLNRHSSQPDQSQRKRHNAGEPDNDGYD